MRKRTKTGLSNMLKLKQRKTLFPSLKECNIIGIVVTFLVVLFFAFHQMQFTGFFSSSFGTIEMLLFYLSLMAGMVTAIVRALFSRRNLARLFDMLGARIFAVTIVWLYITFPFDFTHFADVLPDFPKFLLQWISNDIAKILMLIGMVVAPVMTICNAIMYVPVSRELLRQSQKAA